MAAESPVERDPRWPVVSLADVTNKIGSGATPKGGADTYLPARIKFALVRSQNVFDRHFNYEGLAFISDEQAVGLRGVVLQESDILFNITGDGITFGRACMVPADALPACVNQHVSIVRVDPRRADAGYVLACLTHPDYKPYIESFNAGGSRRAVTKGHIESFRIPLPTLPEQRAIAHILGTLDDKIELNRRMSETLEQMVRALFNSWFVDFDPVRVKAAGEAPPGLSPDLAGQFPDQLVDSEQRDIPVGWSNVALSQLVEVERGLSYKGAGLADRESGKPMHNLNSVLEGGGYKYTGIKFYSGDYKPRHIARAGDIVVANTEQGHKHLLIGFPAIIPASHEEGLFSHHLYRVRLLPDAGATKNWLYYALMAPHVREQIIGHANGSTVNMLRATGLQVPLVALPPVALCEQFDVLAQSIHARIENCVAESVALAELRDLLLPRLISGKLRVEDAESALEAA